jgi:hypothetical protein
MMFGVASRLVSQNQRDMKRETESCAKEEKKVRKKSRRNRSG